jgi:hypothetical protein
MLTEISKYCHRDWIGAEEAECKERVMADFGLIAAISLHQPPVTLHALVQFQNAPTIGKTDFRIN